MRSRGLYSASTATTAFFNPHCCFNTSPPDDRSVTLKESEDIADVPDDSHDVYLENFQMRYIRRPDNIEHICLAV